MMIVLLIIVIAGAYTWKQWSRPDLPEAIASGNGRIEATEVSIASKLPGRIESVHADEGAMVEAGQVLAQLETNQLQAQLQQAEAQLAQARQQKVYSTAVLAQRNSELKLAEKKLARANSLYENSNTSLEQLQQSETALLSAKAAVSAAGAQETSADAAILAAIAQTHVIKASIDDSVLKSPVSGRVLYRLVEPGEVVGAGSNVLIVLDVTDVYMTLFLPTSQAGKVALGAPARIVLDALPNYVIPATVTFVAARSQFTPREVETRTEREKLMFRVKVRIDPKLLAQHIERVKTGLPGVAYVRLDDNSEWPASLQVRVPEQ